MPTPEPQRTCRVTCSKCGAAGDYVYDLIGGEESNSSELRDQLRERYGLMWNALTYSGQFRSYCPDCGPVVAQELMDAYGSPLTPAEARTAPLNAQEKLL